MISNKKTSEQAKKITDNFLSAILWLLCERRFRKIYLKKVTYFRFKCSYSNMLQELYTQVGNFLL